MFTLRVAIALLHLASLFLSGVKKKYIGAYYLKIAKKKRISNNDKKDKNLTSKSVTCFSRLEPVKYFKCSLCLITLLICCHFTNPDIIDRKGFEDMRFKPATVTSCMNWHEQNRLTKESSVSEEFQLRSIMRKFDNDFTNGIQTPSFRPEIKRDKLKVDH